MITIHISHSNKGILDAVIDALRVNRKDDPDGHHIVIAPDNAALYVEFKIMNDLGLFGAFDIEVASFMRLAKKYLNLSGVLTDEGAMMILKKVLTENDDALKCFKSASKSYGFLKEAYEFIKDIRNSRIDIDKIDKIKASQKLKYKLGDAAFLYKRYIKELQEGYGDSLSYLEKLCAQIDKIPHLSSAHIYIMLYDGFSSLELDIIEKLFADSVSVDVGILGNDSAPNAAVFGESGVKESLIARAAEYRYSIKIHEPERRGVFKRINDNLFSYAKQNRVGSEGRIRLVEAKSPYEEAAFAAREINAAVGAGMNYGDIAVLTANPSKYSTYIKTVFERFGIPFSAGAKNKLAFGALPKFLAAAGGLCKKNFNSEIFFDFIKNPYSDISESGAEEFENFCVGHGVEYPTFPLSDEDAERVRTEVLNAVSPFKNRSGAMISAREFSEFTAEFFALNKVAEKTEAYASSESDAEDVYFRIQSYKKINSILNESQRVFGNRRFTLSEFFDIFLAEVASAEIAPLQQKLNVFTGGLSDKVFDKKILFILGADRGALPGEPASSRIVSDGELRLLKDEGIAFDDEGAAMKARAVELLSSPSEKLFICRTEGGRHSPIFAQLFGMFDDLKITSPYESESTFENSELNEAEFKKAFGISELYKDELIFGITNPKENPSTAFENSELNELPPLSDSAAVIASRAPTPNEPSNPNLAEPTAVIASRASTFREPSNLNLAEPTAVIASRAPTPDEQSNLNPLSNDEFKPKIPLRGRGLRGGATEEEPEFPSKRELDEFLYLASSAENLSAAVMRGLPKLSEKNRGVYAAAFSLLSEKDKKRAYGRIAELDAENGAEFLERRIDGADKLFFRGGIFRVTQAENYYRCPYLHFLKYGIRLREREEGELEARDAGNIVHNVLERFIIGAKRMDEDQAAAFAEKIIDGVTDGEAYAAKLSSPKNIGIKRRLKKDILRICKDLHSFIRNSDFKPAFAEAIVAKGGDFSPAELKSGLCLNGKIDRIDLMEKNAVVIDYKTGSVSGNVLSDAYYGNNLQLFSYLAALQKNGYKPAAALYLKIKDDFLNEKDAEFRYRTTGVVIDDTNIITSLDKDMKNRTGKSKILPIEIKEITEKSKENVKTNSILNENELNNTEKTKENPSVVGSDLGGGEFQNIEKKKENISVVGSALSGDEFEKAVSLGIIMTDRAVDEIMSGYIAKKPVKTKGAEACAFCEYKAFCGNDKRVRIQRTAKKEEIFAAIDAENTENMQSD
jgi:ATP-dependent helicase/DNAse subunit B